LIFENYQLAYRNVVSKLYNFYPDEIETAIKDLTAIIETNHHTVTGDLFFCMLSPPDAEIMTAEIFIPIEEKFCDIPASEKINFNSYFSIENAIMARILNEYNEQSQIVFWNLLSYSKKEELTPKTPIFVEYKHTYQGTNYVQMCMGVK